MINKALEHDNLEEVELFTEIKYQVDVNGVVKAIKINEKERIN